MADSYKGIYSTQDLLRRGMAAPGQAGAKKRFWMVWEEGGGFRAQPISSTMQPLGTAQLIGSAEFSARFKRESDSLLSEEKIAAMAPAQKNAKASPTETVEQNAAPTRASLRIQKPGWVRMDGKGPDTAIVGGAAPSAEKKVLVSNETSPVEPAALGGAADLPVAGASAPADSSEASRESAVSAREQSMRAEFATALTRLRGGQRARAIAQIESLLTGPKISDPAFRHMFTDFGINLRKSKLPALALRTHLEARRLSPKDSHILFNAARVTYEMNDLKRTRAFLAEALELSPDLEPARRFLDFLDRKTAK